MQARACRIAGVTYAHAQALVGICTHADREVEGCAALTLGSAPPRFQTKPPAHCLASRQQPGPDLHRQTTMSLRTRNTPLLTYRHCFPSCLASESSGLALSWYQCRPGSICQHKRMVPEAVAPRHNSLPLRTSQRLTRSVPPHLERR